MVATDYWKPYEGFVPPEKHIQSKAETFTVEGYNSLFRHFLARLRRKTKCYSKSEKMLKHSFLMLKHSFLMLMTKRNEGLDHLIAMLN